MASSSVADYGRLPDSHLAEHESDPEGGQRGYVKATDYTVPYTSQWSRLHREECEKLLRCVNCSYLSTPGVPPTLAALKQHAQALCNLILLLCPTVRTGEIDAGRDATGGSAMAAVEFWKNDAFDFLADLGTPYTNDDPHHHMPLTSLLNEVRAHSDLYGTDYHCPLTTTATSSSSTQLPPRAKGEPVRPYANHHNLLMHANACLERLDHELGTEGGLMAVLPGDSAHETGDKAAARNSLLGQWLAFTQHLVRRTHELELSYGNALDVLAGDAAVPHHAASSAGLPDARDPGRQAAHAQDRWLLANAGADVWAHVHELLDRQEVVADERERQWRAQGVSGERHRHADREHARGIVHVDLRTRYYRLGGGGHGTVFVVPGWEQHPGVEHTRALEGGPRIVGTPRGAFPARASELEARMGREREEAREQVGRAREAELRALREQNAELRAALAAQASG